MMISKEIEKGQLEKKKILPHSFPLFLFSSCPSHTYTTTKPTLQPITTTLDSKNMKKNDEKKIKTTLSCLTKYPKFLQQF